MQATGHSPSFEKAIADATRQLETLRRRSHLNSPQYRGDLIHALTKLAGLRLQEKDYAKADRLYREAEMHADEEWKHVPPEIRVKLKSQRGFLCECEGETEAAIERYESGLRIAEENDITLSETRAVIHNNLAILTKRAERWKESEHHYKMSLVILEMIVGGNNEKVAAIYNNIGAFYTQRGKIKSAIRVFSRSLRIRERVFGKDDSHPEIRQSLKNLGAAYRALGNEEAASVCFDRVPIDEVVIFLKDVFTDEVHENLESFANVA